MAVSKSVEKTRLLVRVENTDGSLKNLAFNNIRESASDEELLLDEDEDDVPDELEVVLDEEDVSLELELLVVPEELEF